MNILYLTNKPIYPISDGGSVAMNQFLKCLLHAGFNVKNYTISTPKHPFEISNFPEKLESIIRPENFYIKTNVNPLDAFKNLFKKDSYNINRFYSKKFENKIIKYIQENNIQLLVIESIFFANYIDQIKKECNIKILLRSHNVEFQIWKKLAINEKFLLKKIYLKKLANDIQKQEELLIQKVDGVACISKSDKNYFKVNFPTIKLATIPVVIESNQIISNYENFHFFHLGSMNWKPNIQTVEILIHTIFPLIKKKLPQSKLILAGSNMPEKYKSNPKDGIEIKGYIDDVPEFMSQNGIMLVPLMSGSGVKIKILEGLNMGIPIITTSIGAEGIDTCLNNNPSKPTLIVENDFKKFSEEAIKLATSFENRKMIGQNGLKLIQKKYKIENVTQKLIEFIKYIS
ncbi:MAG: glycosyltransferase family 4 protein [Flavobacteriia bacterium]|nr:glycosyltransferase family 4 protein [Flavobacteriia bacterium]